MNLSNFNSCDEFVGGGGILVRTGCAKYVSASFSTNRFYNIFPTFPLKMKRKFFRCACYFNTEYVICLGTFGISQSRPNLKNAEHEPRLANSCFNASSGSQRFDSSFKSSSSGLGTF